MSRLDVVLFGATGFTGRHAVGQLAGLAAQRGLTWAVAGRSKEKLLQTLKEVGDKIGVDLSSTTVLLADVYDEPSLLAMCAQARVLVNCCGPYTLYGEAVVQAAIHSKTHYVDVSGETNFIELMHVKYDQKAREAGVYVISACGFESIPVDLGVLFLQQNFGGVLNSVECYMSSEARAQSVNFGTWHSMIHALAHFIEMPALSKKIYPKPLPPFSPKLRYRLPLHKRDDGWCVPFPSYDVTAVRRTQRYFYEKDGIRPAQFNNYVKIGSFLNTLAVGLTFIFIFIMSHFKFTRKILLEKASVFSLGFITDGPADSVVKDQRFEFKLFGRGWDHSDAADIDTVPPRKTVVATVSGVNPGYGTTVAALLLAALAVLHEHHQLPSGGGVMSPGIAFAKTSLVKNLQNSGVNFQIVQKKLHED